MAKEGIYWVIADTLASVRMSKEWIQAEKASIKVFYFASFAPSKTDIISCDAVLFLLDKSHEAAITAIKTIKSLAPALPIVAVVKKGNITAAVAMMRANVQDVIENVGDWQGIVKRFIKVGNKKSSNCQLSFTSAEKDVMQLLCRGHTNIEIAKILGRHERTIEEHRATLFRKLNVNNNLHFVRRALEANLLKK